MATEQKKRMSLRGKQNAGSRTVPESCLCPSPKPSLKLERLEFQRNPLWSGQSALGASTDSGRGRLLLSHRIPEKHVQFERECQDFRVGGEED